MSPKQQAIVNAYKTLLDKGQPFTNEDVAKLAEGDNYRAGGKARVTTVITELRKLNQWPFERRKPGRPMNILPENSALKRYINNGPMERNKRNIESIDPETEALTTTVRLLNTLPYESMKKVIDIIKKGAFTFDEMSVLNTLTKLYEELDDEAKMNLFDYINKRFKLE